MALDTAILDQVPEVLESLALSGELETSPGRTRLEIVILAALAAIHAELVAQTALLTTIEENTSPS
jgi:hypothetical protein